jgi:hypothetical protein
VLSAVVALDRPALKARVVDSPEVLSVLGGVPHLGPFLTALHECDYAGYLKAFVGLMDLVRGDMYLAPHLRWCGFLGGGLFGWCLVLVAVVVCLHVCVSSGSHTT